MLTYSLAKKPTAIAPVYIQSKSEAFAQSAISRGCRGRMSVAA